MKLENSLAADPFLGCQEYCAAKARKTNGNNNDRAYNLAFDNCMVQSQTEGFCGAKPSSQTNPPQEVPIPQDKPDTAADQKVSDCIGKSESAIRACDSSQGNATNSCDANSNDTLKGSAVRSSQSSSQAGASVQDSCSTMAGISQGSIASLSSFKQTCTSDRKSCMDSCFKAESEILKCLQVNPNSAPTLIPALKNNEIYKAVKSNSGKCVALQDSIDKAESAIANFNSTDQSSTACSEASGGDQETTAENNKKKKEEASDLSGLAGLAGLAGEKPIDPANDASQANDPDSAYCKAHPTVASCVLDCSKPAMANNPTCSYLKNPMANANENSLPSTGLGSVVNNNQAMDSNTAMPDLGLADNPTPDSNGWGGSNGSSSGEDVGGKTGGGANLGGGGGFGGSGGGSGSGSGMSSNLDSSVIGSSSGYYGSSGGGSNSSGGYGGGGGAYAGGATASSYNSDFKESPDLRKFLPGGVMDPKRGLAGLTGADGVTGPNSDIWQKVQNRYKIMLPTLLP